MASACKLITSVDVEDKVADPGQVAVTVRHEAVLADGRRFLLLDDRGWGSSQLWSEASAREIEETTRVVVGPDAPSQGYTREKMETDHWSHLAEILKRNGVTIDAREMRHLPHDIILSQRILERINHPGRHREPPAT